MSERVSEGNTTIRTLPVQELLDLSRPVFQLFAGVEPKPWDRQTILVELVGEIGSLAHQVQHWDGFKIGSSDVAKLADECSDVLLIVLRLAQEDAIDLPFELELPGITVQRAAELVITLSECVSRLARPSSETLDVMCQMLQALGSAANLFGFDLVEAHRREMKICQQFFAASGKKWPNLQPLRHPIAVFRLYRLLRERKTLDQG